MMNSDLLLDVQYEMEKIHKEAKDAIVNTINFIHNIWVDIYGVEDSLNTARVDDLKTKILSICDDLQDQAQSQKNALIQRVEDVLKEIVQLEQLLDMEGHSVKDYKNINIPLVEMDRQLWSVLSEYRAEKDQRMEKMKTLQAKQETLCSFLNIQVPALNLKNDPIPTVAELEKMEDDIYKLEVQQRDLLDEFYECRKAVAVLIKELDMVPVLKCEVASCKENDALFPPNKKNLEELKASQQNLMTRLNNVKLEAAELRAKLKEIWGRCKWDPNDLNKILQRHSGHSKVDISQLKRELSICEEERRTHVKEFIMDLREEISNYWDMLYFSEEDRKKFKSFYTSDYNEDVLVIHEIELENLKKHYEKYKNMYQLTEKRKEFWDRLKSIEAATKDPNRLFRNRGGQLLQEEKERKIIHRELPKIEDELLESISEYEQETGTSFYVYGHNMRDLIKSEWDNWQASKDSEKKARKIGHVLEVESKQGTRNVVGTKRKMPATPKQHKVSNKIPKLCGPSNQRTLPKTTRQQKPVGQPRSATGRKILTPGRHEVIPIEPCVSPYPATSTPFASFVHTSPNPSSVLEQTRKIHSNKGESCQVYVKQTSDHVLQVRNLPNTFVVRTPHKSDLMTSTKIPKKTPSKSPFKIATGSKIPSYKSPKATTPGRRKLPIII